MSNHIKLRLEVYNSNSFLKSLIQKKIKIYDIKQDRNTLDIIIDDYDYDVIKKMKTIKKIKIIKVYGIKGLLLYIKKYYYIVLVIILGICINLFLSSLIFSVEVSFTNQKLCKIIINDLNEFGIAPYRFKKTYNEIQDIKEKILLLEKNNIEWIEIENHGSKYIVKIEEKKISPENNDCAFRNIVSKKDAMITRVEAIDGEIVKRKNEYVVPGEIIISGDIHNGEDVVSKRCASGKVFGEVWYRVTLSIPIDEEKEILKDEVKYGLFSQLGLNKYFEKYSSYQLFFIPIIYSNIYPFNFGIAKYQKKEVIAYHYDLDNIDSIAYIRGEELLKKKIKEYKILRKKILKKEIKNSKIIIEVFYSVEENIGEYQLIEESE